MWMNVFTDKAARSLQNYKQSSKSVCVWVLLEVIDSMSVSLSLSWRENRLSKINSYCSLKVFWKVTTVLEKSPKKNNPYLAGLEPQPSSENQTNEIVGHKRSHKNSLRCILDMLALLRRIIKKVKWSWTYFNVGPDWNISSSVASWRLPWTLLTDVCGPQRMNSNYCESFEFMKCYQQVDIFGVVLNVLIAIEQKCDRLQMFNQNVQLSSVNTGQKEDPEDLWRVSVWLFCSTPTPNLHMMQTMTVSFVVDTSSPIDSYLHLCNCGSETSKSPDTWPLSLCLYSFRMIHECFLLLLLSL